MQSGFEKTAYIIARIKTHHNVIDTSLESIKCISHDVSRRKAQTASSKAKLQQESQTLEVNCDYTSIDYIIEIRPKSSGKWTSKSFIVYTGSKILLNEGLIKTKTQGDANWKGGTYTAGLLWKYSQELRVCLNHMEFCENESYSYGE